MSLFLKLALWIFLSSALVALVNVRVGLMYPEYWGGPNILAGGIQLLAYIGMATGVGFFIAATVEWKSSRSR